MPSSLTTVRPLASVFSTSPPVSVSVRARARCPAAFLGPPLGRLRPIASPDGPGPWRKGLPPAARASPDRGVQNPARPRRGRPRVGRDARPRRRNVHLPPIAYGSRPRLRPRLTLGGRAFPRKPRAFGAGDSHPRLATRASILTPGRSTPARRRRFTAPGKLPYRCGRKAASRRFGAQLSPVNCRRPDTRPVGCYAVLGRVAASGPTSWLSARPDILGHSAATWGPWRAVWAVPLSGAELSSRVLTPRPWPACVRSSVPFGRLRRPLGDPVALPPAGCPAGQP